MTEIQRITIYKLGGKEYRNIDDIKVSIENSLGAIIDNADVTLTPSQKLKILDAIVSNKKTLVDLLGVVLDVADDSMAPNNINILDY